MRLIANVEGLRSEGKEIPKGGEFEESEKNALILKKLGKASDAPEKKPVPKLASAPAQSSLSLSDKQMKAEVAGDETPATPRRRYQRRDMVAEGSGNE